MKNGQKSSLYGETSLYSEEIPYSELFSKIHYIEYPLYYKWELNGKWIQVKAALLMIKRFTVHFKPPYLARWY